MTNSYAKAFSGRSVFVTGHTGFKGSWLVQWLHSLGARVTGYALDPPTQPNNFTISGVREMLIDHCIADIRAPNSLLRAMKKAQPDVVLHLAAESVVRRSYRSVRETFDTNVIGTCNVLDAIKQLDHPCVAIMVTSDKCYANTEQVWGYRECDPMGGHDPYSASKGAAELLIASYRRSFFPPDRLPQHGIKLASARAGNVIGGGDWTENALIVDAVFALSRNEPVRIRSPRSIRPWQHVLQALSGYLSLASRLLASDDPDLCDAWNFGPMPGDEISVRDVVECLFARWGSGRWIEAREPDAPHECHTLRISINRAMWHLGWEPQWNVATSIAATADWYRQYFENPAGLPLLNLQQIAAYEGTLLGPERGPAS